MGHIAESRLRVRYAETDQMGVVYYSNYLVWMEIGRGDLCRKCGFIYRDLEDQEGIRDRRRGCPLPISCLRPV